MSISHLKKVNQSQKEDKEGQCPKKWKLNPNPEKKKRNIEVKE